jgi:uncharacterized ion transporter superfamily protein YfcC
MENESRLINITKKSFISVVLILLALIITAGILTYVIPAGEYARDILGQIIPDTYSELPLDEGYPIWRWFTAPFEVLG